MTVFSEEISSVKEDIENNGLLISWNLKSTETSSDPAKPWKVNLPSSTSSEDAYVLFLQVPSKYKKYIKGTEKTKTSYYGMMAQQTFIPKLQHTITKLEEGVETDFKIIWLDKFAPDGDVIFYEFICQA